MTWLDYEPRSLPAYPRRRPRQGGATSTRPPTLVYEGSSHCSDYGDVAVVISIIRKGTKGIDRGRDLSRKWTVLHRCLHTFSIIEISDPFNS